MNQTALSAAEREQFIHDGFIVLHDCFSREQARQWTERAWVRLGCNANDASTWPQARAHMPSLEGVDVETFAPKAWGAICDLLGGAERIQQPCRFSDGFIVNFNDGIDRPWQEPSANIKGWHKDGDFFRHFLDSPEQGLLTLVIWSNIEPHGGGTFVARDSVAPVARFLAEHPAGVLPGQFDFRDLIGQCSDFIEMTARCGDVVLLHPFMLHASSQNHSGVARFLTNPPVSLREPMCFDRPDAADFSPVEQAVLRALNVEQLEFAPTAPRERMVPERVKHQQPQIEAEKARLAAVQ